MKPFKILTTILLFTLASTACMSCKVNWNTTNFGEDHYTTEDLKQKPFAKIDNEAIVDVYYTQNNDDKYNVRVDYSEIKDSDICEFFKKSMRIAYIDGKLIIDQVGKTDSNFKLSGNHRPKVYVTSPDLIEIDNEGVGSIYTKSINSDVLEITNEGVGSVSISSLLVNRLNISNEGVGSIKVQKVEADDVEVDNEGVGSIDLNSLTSKRLDIDNEGVGKVTAHVKCDILKANLEGIGSIKLSGTTRTFSKQSNGIGRIKISDLKIEK